MNRADFENTLRLALHDTPAMQNEHVKRVRLLAGNEARQRRRNERIAFHTFLNQQIRFIGWKIWGAQGVLVLLLGSMLHSLYGPCFWESPRSMLKALFCLSVLAAMTALPLIYRVVRYRMQEIEGATYYSSVKLLMAKLAVVWIGDIFLLAGLFAGVITKTSLSAGSISLYLCVPFLLVSSGMLFLLGHVPFRYFIALSISLCALLFGIVIVLPGRLDLLFGQSFGLGWLAVCALLIAFCAGQCRYLLCRCPYGEMQTAY